MEVENAVLPNDEQMKGFAQLDAPGAIYMVNLLKFKDKAEYADGRQTDLTGAEAYQLYGQGVQKLLADVGGKVTFGGNVERLVIGEVAELWDQVVIAMYPSRQAMLEMMMSQGMQELSAHRSAGLAGQLNIETSVDLPETGTS